MKVRLPMAVWHDLSRKLDPEAFCMVLATLGADGRTYTAAAARAVWRWKDMDAMVRRRFTCEPMADRWSRLAYLLAIGRVPLGPPVIRDIRRILVVSGSVDELLDLGAKYGTSASGMELSGLADALYGSSLNRHDWTKWSVLVKIAGQLAPGDVAQYVSDKHGKAVDDFDFDG